MRNKMWSVRKRGVGYAVLYDGMGVGITDNKAPAQRLVAAANACAMVSSDALKDMDVERLLREHGELLAACEQLLNVSGDGYTLERWLAAQNRAGAAIRKAKGEAG